MRKLLLIAVLVAALGALSAGIAIASGLGADGDEPLTGSNLDRATAAALEHIGGGTVVEAETGDDGAAYGVEIRRRDGSVVEVELDRAFRVIGEEVDDDGADERHEPGDDD